MASQMLIGPTFSKPTSVRFQNPHLDAIIRRLAGVERRSYRAQLETLVVEALINRGERA